MTRASRSPHVRAERRGREATRRGRYAAPKARAPYHRRGPRGR